jgi:hypothetical protein
MTAALEGVRDKQHAPAALYPRERPATHFTGGWVGPRAGLDGRKISSPPGFDTGPSSPWSVIITTELPGRITPSSAEVKKRVVQYIWMEFSNKTTTYTLSSCSPFVPHSHLPSPLSLKVISILKMEAAGFYETSVHVRGLQSVTPRHNMEIALIVTAVRN